MGTALAVEKDAPKKVIVASAEAVKRRSFMDTPWEKNGGSECSILSKHSSYLMTKLEQDRHSWNKKAYLTMHVSIGFSR